MTEFFAQENYAVQKENLVPICIKAQSGVENAEKLTVKKAACVSFKNDNSARFSGRNAYVILDFGAEICGSVRLIATSVTAPAVFRLSVGESLSECVANIGENHATNDHSLRDIEITVPTMSDQTYLQSGFRFARIELLSDSEVCFSNIFAVSTMPYFEKEGGITCGDELMCDILNTAKRTLKLNLQNGYIFDGIKRDRLVWSGDLNQEIITSLYLFGDNAYIRNSLEFLRAETPPESWINGIPTYSAWWVINFCDYVRISDNRDFFNANRNYAEEVLANFDKNIDSDGSLKFVVSDNAMSYFLDWQSYATGDALVGTALLILLSAQKYLTFCDNACAKSIVKKLSRCILVDTSLKQTRALQILAGRKCDGDAEFLQKDGAKGFSTFMAYYILSAYVKAGGKNVIELIKEYFGGMLSLGATTFWEDFDVSWLCNASPITEFASGGLIDVHAMRGAHCYKGFRHSLCHGWASGVYAFFAENIIGLNITEKGYTVTPDTFGIDKISAEIPFKGKWMKIEISGENITVTT